MKKSLFTLIGLGAFALPVLAMGEGAVQADANGDGVLSMEEVQAVYPDVTAEMFLEADANSDGALDDAEVIAAKEKGMIPADG